MADPRYLVVACYEDPRQRFSLQLNSDKRLHLKTTREMYQKLGLEGKKMDKKGTRYEIVLDLQDARYAQDSPARRKTLKNLRYFFDAKLFDILISCSPSATKKLQHFLSCESILFVAHNAAESSRILSTPCPLIACPASELPQLDDLEEWDLWLGGIVNSLNLLLPETKMDPFFGVCRISDGETRMAMHSTLRAPIITAELIAEHLESLDGCADEWDLVALVGRNSTNSSGFSIYLQPDHCFLCCSSVTN